jgi:hypothetical protein
VRTALRDIIPRLTRPDAAARAERAAQRRERAALRRARFALRRARWSHRLRIWKARHALGQVERAHAREVTKAQSRLRTAEDLHERKLRAAEAALTTARAPRQLARYGDLILSENQIKTGAGAVALSSKARAVVETAANLLAAGFPRFSHPGGAGRSTGSVLAELRKHPRREYLLVESPEFLTLVRCHRDDQEAEAFAQQLNVAALNVDAFEQKRRAAMEQRKQELMRLETAPAPEIEEAKAALAAAEGDTAPVEAARTTLPEVEADTGEIEQRQAELLELERAATPEHPE